MGRKAEIIDTVGAFAAKTKLTKDDAFELCHDILENIDEWDSKEEAWVYARILEAFDSNASEGQRTSVGGDE